MGKKDPSTAPLIKGYLPVRLTLPSSEESPDDTFFYVKEHFAAEKNTLFVANAPVVTGIRTRILLRSLLGRYGDVERVIVVANPRMSKEVSESMAWTTITAPSFFGPNHSEGRFAHVVFISSKEMKKAMKGLEKVMSSKKDFPGLSLEKLEIQTLQDETVRKESGDDENDNGELTEPLTGILAVADRYRKAHNNINRHILLEECNAVMQQYEDAEDEDRIARETAKRVPDEDGFTKVTYSTTKIGSKRELEVGVTTTNNRRGSKRSRTKKEGNGASSQADFYRFQTKEVRKNTLQNLRVKFEEDLAKVKKMKEEREYRPF
jgi:ribosomal RNA-processing protein 7